MPSFADSQKNEALRQWWEMISRKKSFAKILKTDNKRI
jgi:hypothetical protein